MTFNNKYHSAIEAKDAVAPFIRRLDDVNGYAEGTGEGELIKKIGEIKRNCEELIIIADEIINRERPEERILIDPDRGINDFFEDYNVGCDGDCKGGCGGCGGNP